MHVFIMTENILLGSKRGFETMIIPKLLESRPLQGKNTVVT